MVETERKVFGDVLELGGEDPYFWASKLHFYITGIIFYNFPYTFGYLLSRALYRMFNKDGSEFLPKYEAFLRLAGTEPAEKLVQHTIGRDIEKPEFWAEAIDSLEEPLARLEMLLAEVL
jgi:oligoendopeptidase F